MKLVVADVLDLDTVKYEAVEWVELKDIPQSPLRGLAFGTKFRLNHDCVTSNERI